MAIVLRELTTPCLVAAIEENLYCFMDLLGRWPNANVHQAPGLSWCLSDVRFPLFNSIMQAHLGSEAVESAIEARIEAARARNVPIAWWTGPSTRPPDLCTHLKHHGFMEVQAAHGMAVTLAALNEPPPVPGLTIEVARSPEALQQWGLTYSLGFDATGDGADRLGAVWCDLLSSADPEQVTCYLGFLDEKPVGTSMLIRGAGVAGIYAVGTIPEARRKGIGGSMTTAPLRDAREAGYLAGISQASAMGRNLYWSLGFREYCKIYEYVWKPGTQ